MYDLVTEMKKLTKSQLAVALHSDDIDLATRIGRKAPQHLRSIAKGKDESLAMFGIFVAGVINEESTHSIVEEASRSRKVALRMAAAMGAAHLESHRAERILLKLLKSRRVTVRKCAILSAARVRTPKLIRLLSEIGERDSDIGLRKLANDTLSERRTTPRKKKRKQK